MLGCSPTTVASKVERIARQALRFQVDVLRRNAEKLSGGVVFDGFASFEYAQYFPYWLNVAVHQESSFTLGFTESPHRRRGTMTAAQRRKRADLERELGTPPRDSVESGTADLLDAIRDFFDLAKSRLISDLCPFYPAAVAAAGWGGVPWERVPGRRSRTPDNPMHEINLTDLLIRHGSSNQKRETIAFNKRRQAGLERGWLWAIWRNFMRPRHIKTRTPPPAVQAGLVARPLTFEEIFGKRLFGWRVPLPRTWERQIRRTIETAVYPRYRKNIRVFAY